MPAPALIVFAKQPLPGQVKTRLQPDYTPEQAAAIAALLIRATVALAASSWPGPVYLCGAPDARHPLFDEIGRRHHVALEAQGAGDLGARMHRAIARGSARHGAAAVLGCDVPQCPGAVLADAAAALARGRNVLGPTEDGGYYLIGLAGTPRVEMFTDIAWGKERVLALTRARAAALGVDFTLLPTLRDIDTMEDLRCVAATFEPLRSFGEA